jgi:hypothetical protein
MWKYISAGLLSSLCVLIVLSDRNVSDRFWFTILAVFFIWFFVGWLYDLQKMIGQPVTVRKLQKKVFYCINGIAQLVDETGNKKQVLFLRRHNDRIIAVILPVELPEGTCGFHVLQAHDGFGDPIKGMGVIMINHPDRSGEQFRFKWDSKSQAELPEEVLKF